jgi:hypothetical protein
MRSAAIGTPRRLVVQQPVTVDNIAAEVPIEGRDEWLAAARRLA